MTGYNRLMLWLLLSPFHWLVSGSILGLHIRGVTSGRVYEFPVNYVTITKPEGLRYLITSQRDRTWWRNLRAPVEIEIFIQGRRARATAQAFESSEEVAQGLSEYFKGSPGSARFFKLALNSDGSIPQDEVRRIAEERVVVWVDPISKM